MKITTVHFKDYVLIPGQKNGRTLTIFAKDVDKIELLPNGIKIEKGGLGCFFFQDHVRGCEYDVETKGAAAVADAVPIKLEKGKPAKLVLEGPATNE